MYACVYVDFGVCMLVVLYQQPLIIGLFAENDLRSNAGCGSSPPYTTCTTFHTYLFSCALQQTATHCNTLQHTATRSNTLQHTATHVVYDIQHALHSTHISSVAHVSDFYHSTTDTHYTRHHIHTLHTAPHTNTTPGPHTHTTPRKHV